MADVSHNGAIYTIAASKTTAGKPVQISAFPKDTDPFDVPSVEIGDVELGTNGDPIYWTILNVTETTVAIIPATEDHETMQKIYDQNKAEKGKRGANDLITVVRILPNGETTTFKGRMTGGSPTTSLASSGKIKTPTYNFKWHKIFRNAATITDAGF